MGRNTDREPRRRGIAQAQRREREHPLRREFRSKADACPKFESLTAEYLLALDG